MQEEAKTWKKNDFIKSESKQKKVIYFPSKLLRLVRLQHKFWTSFNLNYWKDYIQEENHEITAFEDWFAQ